MSTTEINPSSIPKLGKTSPRLNSRKRSKNPQVNRRFHLRFVFPTRKLTTPTARFSRFEVEATNQGHKYLREIAEDGRGGKYVNWFRTKIETAKEE